MTDPRTIHPKAELLAAYAEGQLANVREMESHLRVCAICAEGVLIARQVAFVAEAGAVPPLSNNERHKAKSRLAGLLKTRPLKANPSDPAAGSGSGQVTLASLGALGMLGLGRGLSAAKPLLAGHEAPDPHDDSDTHEESASHPLDHSGANPHADHHFEHSGQHDEMNPGHPASSSVTPADPEDELSNFLDQSAQILNDRHSHESSGLEHPADESFFHPDHPPSDEHDSAAPHTESFDHATLWNAEEDASEDEADLVEADETAPADDPQIDPTTDAGHDDALDA